MKKLILVLASAFVLSTAAFFCACNENEAENGNQNTTQPETPNGSGNTNETPELLNFTGITFADKTLTYNGEEHSVTVSGTLPEGANVEYTNNKGTNAGVYNATAEITKDGYNSLTLTAKLTIEKAKFSGIAFKDQTFVANGSERKIEITGELPEPEITKVAYTDNSAKAAGVYNAKAVITNPNYETLTLSAVLTVKSIATVASEIVNSILDKPDPWSFLPEAFSHENMAYSALPANDFTSFVNVSSIGDKIIGKQFNVLYEGLTDTSVLLGYFDSVYAVGGTIANVYQTYINKNPDDYRQFSGEAGGFKFRITLDGDKSELLAGNSTVSLELTYDGVSKERTGRIQLNSGMALKYQYNDNYLKFAVKTTINDVGNLKQIEFIRSETAVAGYMYEYTGTENTNLKASAVITSNPVKTTITSNKREADDLKINYYEEVYDSKTGKFIGGETNEKISESSSKNYDTLWFMLDSVSGFNSVKAVHKQNVLNADTIYINGSNESIHTKTVSLLDTSRRFDIEMKDVWYVVAETDENGKTKYTTIKCSIPMLFVQASQASTFGSDFKEKNDNVTTAPVLPSFTAITQDYEKNAELFTNIKDLMEYEAINSYIGTKNIYFN